MISLRFQCESEGCIELSFDRTTTVAIVKGFLAKRLATIPDNIALLVDGQMLDDSCALVNLSLPKGTVINTMVAPSRIFEFIQPGREPFSLPFRESATVLDAKRALSPKLKSAPDRITLSVDDEDLDDSILLIDLDLHAPRFITVDVDRDGSALTSFMFILQGEGVSLELEEDATVADAEQELLTRLGPRAKRVRLLVDGRPLKNSSATLSSLNIPKGEFIMTECEMGPFRRDNGKL